MKWAPLLRLLVAVPATFAATLHPVPQISSLAPVSVAPGASAFTLTVNGANFVRGAMVQWNGSSRVTTLVSSTQLTAKILATDIANAGTATIQVVNGASGSRSRTWCISPSYCTSPRWALHKPTRSRSTAIPLS